MRPVICASAIIAAKPIHLALSDFLVNVLNCGQENLAALRTLSFNVVAIH
jgi:hypothetical protein